MQQATLLLPEKAAAPGSMAGPDEDDDTGAGIKAPVRVLIVEDEVLTALDIEYLVEGMGYDVCGMVASAPEAIKAAQDQRPDIVLMDIRLAHGTDGIQEAGAIRDRFGIPSLYLSAHTILLVNHLRQIEIGQAGELVPAQAVHDVPQSYFLRTGPWVSTPGPAVPVRVPAS